MRIASSMNHALAASLAALAAATALLFAPAEAGAREYTDVVVMRNGDHLTGRIKKLEKSMLTFQPRYTKKVDILLEWGQVAYIESEELFVLATSRGERFTGSFRMTAEAPDSVVISGKLTIPRYLLVEIQELKATFWKRWKLDLYVGYTLTKANSQNQLNMRGDARYRTDRSETKLGVNSLLTIQKEGQESKRVEGSAGWRRELAHLWFVTAALNGLRSDEQALDLRSTTSGGFGRYIFRNTIASMNTSIGVAWTHEEFMDPASKPLDSGEGVLSAGGDVYGYRNLDFKTTVDVYPSITESGRWRVNINLDTKWEIVKDMNFLINYFQNWDNASDAGSDYGIVSSIGWSL